MSHGVRKVGLEAFGFERAAEAHWNLSVPALYERAVQRGEGVISIDGPIVKMPTCPLGNRYRFSGDTDGPLTRRPGACGSSTR